uniref:Growth hormone releasing hormone receptor n=1 Tax=Electrophorus electricus TaxID=8005 RepID=A0AAY5ERI0_ELEEL
MTHPYQLKQCADSHCLCVRAGCLPVWDSVVCWPKAAVGDTVHSPCPAVFSLFSNTTGTVSRNCTSAGWSQPFPPYHEACSVYKTLGSFHMYYRRTVKLIYSIGYGASLISLMVAVAILLSFRRLRCARNYIHIQLFFSFILKAASVFIKDATLFASQDTNHCSLSTVSAACKASVVFCHYCVMSNFSWLLMEAVYLNFLLVSALPRTRRCLWGFALLGWGVPLVFIILWIGSRMYFEDMECWDINEDSPYWWTIKGPIVVSIGVNFMLFMNIIRILIQKLNPRLIQFNNSAQYRRLTKSTLLLIPLFGTHYVVFNFLPDDSSVNLRFCIELCLGSFQVPIAPKHSTGHLDKPGLLTGSLFQIWWFTFAVICMSNVLRVVSRSCVDMPVTHVGLSAACWGVCRSRCVICHERGRWPWVMSGVFHEEQVRVASAGSAC